MPAQVRQGSRGSTVTQLQQKLASLGFSPGPIDGIFGPKTRAAVLAFQRSRGIAVDGIVGPQTWGRLAGGGGSPPAAAPAATISTPTGTVAAEPPPPQALPGDLDTGDPIEPPPVAGTRPPPPIVEPPPPIDTPDPPPVNPGDDAFDRTDVIVGLSFLDQTNLLLPWLPDSLATVYAEAWAANDDPTLAMAAVRNDPGYDQLLPGNRRDDGSFRMTEAEYFSTVDAMNQSLAGINLNPEVFAPLFVNAISGDVSAREFDARVQSGYREILANLPDIRAFYAQNFGTDLTDEGIIASFLSPEIGEQVLNRRILSSQIGGSAALRGFDLGLNQAGRLASAGLNQQSSAQFFATAARALPALKQFATRFNEGSFDLAEFTEANVFGDPDAGRKMQRLLGAEQSSFTRSRGVARGRRAGQQSGISVR